MQRRDPAGNEPTAIAALVELDGKRVLEVGRGTGRLTRFLAQRAREVHAFDVKPEAVAEAERSLPHASAARSSSSMSGRRSHLAQQDSVHVCQLREALGDRDGAHASA